MTYSLISAATLGFDLVRTPAGSRVAQVLLAGLAAGPDDVVRLAAAHPRHGATPQERLAAAVRSRRAREAAAGGALRLTGLEPSGHTATLLAQLQDSMIGDAAALERLVRDDLLSADLTDWPTLQAPRPDLELTAEQVAHATDVLADAALSAYAAGALAADVRVHLDAPFAASGVADVSPEDARTADLGPQAEAVRALLADLAGSTASGRQRWRDAVDLLRDRRRPWAAAMHDACWAAHLCGRTRVTAAGQLLAVRAFHRAGFTAADGAAGVWNAVAGCVQGLLLADVAGAETLAVLTEPWTVVTGSDLIA